MKITKANLSYVAHLLRKNISNGFTSQAFYPEAKRFNSILKYFNINNNFEDFLYKIEQSNICEFEKGIIEIEDTYIRIHNGVYSNNDYEFWDDPYKATIVEIGDEIKFNKGLITIRQKFITHDAKCIEKITFNS